MLGFQTFSGGIEIAEYWKALKQIGTLTKWIK